MKHENSAKYRFIAVDFDGTLCKDCFPEIGEPIGAVISFIKEQAEDGAKIILYTCRENHPNGRQYLDEAVAWCTAQGVQIDAANENPWSPYDLPGLKSRKIYADLYVDDKAVNAASVTALHELEYCKCGGEPRLVMGTQGHFWVYCSNCREEIHPTITKEEAIEVWNSVSKG